MVSLEELTRQQATNGEAIQKIISNYRKDSAARKTPSYYEERLRRLQESWMAFETVDSQIRSLPGVPLNHEYFRTDYYHKIKVIVDEFEAYFSSQIQQPLSAAGHSDSDGSDQVRKVLPGSTEEDSQNFELTKAIRGQKRAMEGLKRLLTSIAATGSVSQSRTYFQVQLKNINDQWRKIEQYESAIWEMSTNPSAEGYDTAEYVDLEGEMRRQVLTLSETLAALPAQSPITSLSSANSSLPKLPKLTLPKFDGNYLQWKQFHDLFVQLVHHQDMPRCQKMWYLKTNLSGTAEALLRHFSLSEENYDSAWQTLVNRYNNQRLLVSALINKLLNQPAHSQDTTSAASLRTLHDTTRECLLGLENLNIPVQGWDPMLLHVLIKKLDRHTHIAYEQSLVAPRELPTLSQFLSFIENRFQALEALGDHSRKQGSAKMVAAVSPTNCHHNTCVMCNSDHALFSCKNFLQLPVSERLNTVKKHRLCYNCLKAGHNSSKCSSGTCTKCKRKHNSLLHLSSEQSEPAKTIPVALTTLQEVKNQAYILLGTALVKIITNEGRELQCRALLDSGSQVNIITERVINQLRARTSPSKLQIQGVGSLKREARRRVNIELKSNVSEFSTRLEACVLNSIIPPQPTQSLDTSTWPIPTNLALADPNFNLPARVDILLGAELYHTLLLSGQIKLSESLPLLQNTVLGWVAIGKVANLSVTEASCNICSEDETRSLIERFWKLEELQPTQPSFTLAEKHCENHFAQTINREKGRFIVSLPLCNTPAALGDSKQIALNRFYALERRLARNHELKRQYTAFIEEYLKLGHMEQVDIKRIASPNYFLPHHCILKPESSTTKLRVVFDASCKSSSGLSLNDILHAGPTIQSELFTLLLRFRLPRYAFTTDIEKMYRQILINPDDRKYQLIMWRSSPEEDIKHYQLATVTYGTRPAPYLATKCLQKLAMDNSSRYPLGAQTLLDNFYMDDGIAGSNCLFTAREMQRQLRDLLREAGFKLRKWCANHPQLLQDIPLEDQEKEIDFNAAAGEGVTTLGLVWLPNTDKFHIKAKWDEDKSVTKRTVSSDIARLFDPLGIMAPVVVKAKIFFQQLWQLKLDWDDELSSDLQQQWLTFRKNMAAVNNVHFPRHVFGQQIPKTIQIHAFADASEKAYGAAIYLRCTTNDGQVLVRLLCSKSRVAPLQRQTIPRLELCAAVLASQLVARIKTDLQYASLRTFFWSDSEIVLSWLNSNASSYQPFVANRVAKIQESSLPQQWRHVRSIDNPADILSRGLSPEKLASHDLWFYGPLFLHGKESQWPAAYAKGAQLDDDTERKKTALSPTTALPQVTALESNDIIYKINHQNKFQRLLRIVAYMQRFARATQKIRPTQPVLTPKELNQALYAIVRVMQESSFEDDLQHLKKYGHVDKGSTISSLSPFIDQQGIIRVGGRLQATDLPQDARHQMLIPYADPLTKLLMQDNHEEHMHCGPLALLAHVRQRFWPLKGKTLARSTVQHCVRCTRAKPKLLSQMMGNLPALRVQAARPFINCGVDFCGPIWIHFKSRGKKPQKTYIAIFCCFATKATHLELVGDLSTDAFIGALKRFIGRRGHCQNLYCDNATNFVGARNKLSELARTIYDEAGQTKITEACSKKSIAFHFIPPRAPHFGGLWEAAVKSAKHLLLRSVSTASLTYEELETVIIEIEAILNSRPITPMSSDPNDLEALTPGHFLIGEPLTAQIHSEQHQTNMKLLKRWELVSALRLEFWKRWTCEYLSELQYRYKWKTPQANIKPGTLVIIKDDHLPVMKWPLGRIIRTFEGDDGLVRTAEVKTEGGIFRRAIHRLAPLFCEENNHENSNLPQPNDTQSFPTRPDTIKHHLDRTSEPDDTVAPPKKGKLSKMSLLNSLFLVCILLPMNVVSSQPFVTIEQFNQTPGIHFENIGTIHRVTNEWKMLIYYDLTPYWKELADLTHGVNTLQGFCESSEFLPTCQHVIDDFQRIRKDLSLEDNLFTHKRQKRGAFNIVGTIAKSLFGTLDANYAHEMAETINAIKTDENYLLSLLKNQTSVIDSTINVMKTDQFNTDQKFKEISSILNKIDKNGSGNHQLKLLEAATMLSFQLLSASNNLYRIQAALLQVLTETHHGMLSPLLLSPQQFCDEIKTIQQHLPPSTLLPTSGDDVLALYRLMTVKGRLTGKFVVFSVTLPLIDQGSYDLFNMVPLPILVNKTLMSIACPHQMLAVSAHRDSHFTMTPLDLDRCEMMNSKEFLCTQPGPTHHPRAVDTSCELSLFLNESSTLCELESIPKPYACFQLYDKNKWIIGLQHPARLQVVCGTHKDQIQVNASGLISLQPNCAIRHALFTIRGEGTVSSVRYESFTGSNSALQDLKPSSTPEGITYQPQLANLTKLQQALPKSADFFMPSEIHSQQVHHTIPGYLSLIFSLGLISCIIWKHRATICKCCRNPNEAATSSQQPDFSVNLS